MRNIALYSILKNMGMYRKIVSDQGEEFEISGLFYTFHGRKTEINIWGDVVGKPILKKVRVDGVKLGRVVSVSNKCVVVDIEDNKFKLRHCDFDDAVRRGIFHDRAQEEKREKELIKIGATCITPIGCTINDFFIPKKKEHEFIRI